LNSRETKIQWAFLRFAYDVFIKTELSKDSMYFVLLVGALNLMRWMMCAANCFVNALSRRPGIGDLRFQRTQQIR